MPSFSVDFDGPAVLEWAPHGSLTFAESVRVQVTATSSGWQAHALAPTFDSWWFLLCLGSPYRLVFPDGSTFEVEVGRPDASGRFELRDWTTADGDDRQTPCPDCSGTLWHVSVTDEGSGTITVVDRCAACQHERRQRYTWQPPERV